MRRPFMDAPEQLASLQGQQYLVLRPTASVADEYVRTQSGILARAGRRLPHPHTGHVTLRGFHEPERRQELLALIREWAAERDPIEVSADAIDAFPAPWQIVILRLMKTASLIDSYSSLTAALATTDFRRLDELSIDDWTFHLSVVYARTLASDAWSHLESTSRRALVDRPVETIVEAEFVWYDGGEEYSEIIPLGR